MLKRSLNFYVRKSHRYLGVFIGIQFLLWTTGGFYFSWMNIKEIRGEDLVDVSAERIPASDGLVSPSAALKKISERFGVPAFSRIELTSVLTRPYFVVAVPENEGTTKTLLINAENGELRENFSKDEAVSIARAALNQESQLAGVDYLAPETVGPHHEFRGQPLPAWVVNFSTPREFAVYISAETGKIEAVRTRNWRIFDFLWMMHTMDYNGRDDINNYLLRAFSILGLLTISSGFALFFISSPYLRRRKRLRR